MYKEGNQAKKIIEAQKSNGLWGTFHALSVPDGKPLTTEQALRRLEILGFTKDDEVIRKNMDYMEACLKGKALMVDRREKSHNWDLFTELMLGTWLLRYDSQNLIGLKVARKWAQVISGGFREESFNQEAYNQTYKKVFGEKIYGGIFMDPANFYHVSLLKGQLDAVVEARYVDYLLNHPQGIYYLGYPGLLKELPEFLTPDKPFGF